MLVFGLLFSVFFVGAGEASAAGSDLIIVNKKTNKLAYFSDGKLVKTFPVATGKSKELTPEGNFKMVVKVKNRPYYKENIPGGDPANPLGDRWLGLEVNGTYGTPPELYNSIFLHLRYIKTKAFQICCVPACTYSFQLVLPLLTQKLQYCNYVNTRQKS